MVNVTSNHPFLLRPITSGIKPSTSMSGSRTPSPGHSLATGEDPSPETVPGEGFDGPPRKPFKASLVRLPLRRGRSGRGRGREPRVEVNPPREIVVETGEEETEAPPPSIKPLSEADRETVRNPYPTLCFSTNTKLINLPRSSHYHPKSQKPSPRGSRCVTRGE
jgi:hypothetical protein